MSSNVYFIIRRRLLKKKACKKLQNDLRYKLQVTNFVKKLLSCNKENCSECSDMLGLEGILNTHYMLTVSMEKFLSKKYACELRYKLFVHNFVSRVQQCSCIFDPDSEVCTDCRKLM
jgi:hypothetical protein